LKKVLLGLFIFFLASCTVEVGNFSDKRIKLHEMGYPDNYCEQKPDRCVEGVPW